MRVSDRVVNLGLCEAGAIVPSQLLQELHGWIFHIPEIGGVDLGVT
jgi:hypothetical protein